MKRKLILDYSKWRCGDITTKHNFGQGIPLLQNIEGFQCCLGQFSLQLNENLTEESLINAVEPQDLNQKIELLVYKVKSKYFNTDLSEKAIVINDATGTTPAEKIVLLKELFATVDCEIEVINQPT